MKPIDHFHCFPLTHALFFSIGNISFLIVSEFNVKLFDHFLFPCSIQWVCIDVSECKKQKALEKL